MSLTQLKKELKELEKETLIEMIADLYKKSKQAKELLDFYLNPNEEEMHEKYRQKVYEAFFPKRGYDFKLREGKQAISEFKKLNPSAVLLADLMLFYTETGIKFTNTYGDITQSFYLSLETVFADALELMKKCDLLDKFQHRAFQTLEDTRHIGWGFNETLEHIYEQFYSE